MEPITSLVVGPFKKLLEWKEGLNLPSPNCTFEQMHRESRNISPSNFLFDGAKADISKGLSPTFQVSHSFSMGSSTSPPNYSFGGVFVEGRHLLHGLIDSQGVLQGKWSCNLNNVFSNSNTSESSKEDTLKGGDAGVGGLALRLQTQISKQPGQSMLQGELEYQGRDFCLDFKTINPDPLSSFAGIYTTSFMHSLGAGFSAGLEAIAQKMNQREPFETAVSIGGRRVSERSIMSLTLQQMVAVQLSYVHKVSGRLELGTDLQIMPIGPRRDAIGTMAAKFDYRQALIRGQLDTLGRVGIVYEERLFPGFSLLLSGEIDHLRGASRFGFGINLEN